MRDIAGYDFTKGILQEATYAALEICLNRYGNAIRWLSFVLNNPAMSPEWDKTNIDWQLLQVKSAWEAYNEAYKAWEAMSK